MRSFIRNVTPLVVLRINTFGKQICAIFIIIWLFVIISLVGNGLAQAQPYFYFSEPRKKKSFSFEFHRNLMVVDVMINGHGPFNFVLDTGVGISTITNPSLKQLLNLQRIRNVLIRGLGGDEGSPAFLTSDVKISFSGIESIPLTMVVFEEDPFFLSTYLGVKVDGILGYEFFSSFVSKINYQENLLTVYAPGTYNPGRKYDFIPMVVHSNKPFVKALCTLFDGSPISVDLLVDTGAGFPLSLETYSDSGIRIPAKHLEMQLGLGLSGIIHGSLARSEELKLGNFLFREVVTSFPDYDDWQTRLEPIKRNGSIGNFLLKRFTVVFDYGNGQLFLKPTHRIKEPFKYDRVGIDLVGGGEDFNHFVVHHVKVNSPADEAGILEDDEVMEINFQKVMKLDLGAIDEILSDPDAKNVWLKLKRVDEYIYLWIKMRNLI